MNYRDYRYITRKNGHDVSLRDVPSRESSRNILFCNTPSSPNNLSRSIFLSLILILFLICVPSVMTLSSSSSNIQMSVNVQQKVLNDTSSGYSLTLHLLNILGNASVNTTVNTASLNNSLDGADFSSIYELVVIRVLNTSIDSSVSSADNSINSVNNSADAVGNNTEDNTIRNSYKYFGKLQFPLIYDITEYGSYIFSLSRISDGLIVSEVSFNYTKPSELIQNASTILQNNTSGYNVSNVNLTQSNLVTNQSNQSNCTVPNSLILSSCSSVDATQNKSNFTSLNVLDKCSNVFTKLDKESYMLGDSVQIIFSNIFGKDIDTELTISTTSSMYKFVGDLSDAAFIPPEIGNYTIYLTCDNSIIFNKTFRVDIPIDFNIDANNANIAARDLYAKNNITNNVTWKRIAIRDSRGRSVTKDVRTYRVAKLNITALDYSKMRANYMHANTLANLSVSNTSVSDITDASSNVSLNDSSNNSLNTLSVAGLVDINVSGIGGATDSNLQLDNLVLDQNTDLNLYIEDVPKASTEFIGNVVASYAMDLSNLDFNNGTFTKTAVGKELWKCVAWDFSTQHCNGSWIKIMDITPGAQYNLYVSSSDPGYVETGVATVNTLKSLYYPNDNVDVVMVILDTTGHLVSGADVSLTIISPDNTTTVMSTNDVITPSHRGIYNAEFAGTSLEGNYTMIVRAVGENVNQTMVSQFVVSSTHPFDILRNTPVTIDPKDGSFVSSITLISNLPLSTVSDFDYTEKLPSNFTVITLGGGFESVVGGNRYITWYNLTNNSVVSYSAESPPESPNVYEIGQGFVNYNTVVGNTTYYNNIFYESRPWFLAIDPLFVGSFFMFWDNTSNAPPGWTCVSCNPGDPFYQNFIMGDVTYGGTGGSATHNHIINYVSATVGATYVGESTLGAAGANAATAAHTHAGIVATTTSNASNYPAFRQLKVIAYNNIGIPQIIPAGAIGIFNTTSLPANWTQYTAENNYFILGNATANITGGSNNHTHIANVTTVASAGTIATRTGGVPVAVGNAAHNHTGVANTSLDNNIPPYIDIVLAKTNVSTYLPYGQGFIGMFNTSVGDGWTNLSQPGQPFYQKILRAAAIYNATGGGSNVSNHTTLNITMGAPNSTVNTRTGAGNNYALAAHTHNVTVSFTSANITPPYVDVVFGYANSTPIYPPVINRTDCFKQGTGWVNCTTIKFGNTITAIRTSCYSQNLGNNVSNISYMLMDIEQNITYFNITTANNTGGYFIYNLSSTGNLTITDSGSYNLDIICRDIKESNQDINWTVPWGNYSVALLSPNVPTNVTQNRFFNFSVNVSCIGGECGNASVTLDPAPSWWSIYWMYRRQINITNSLAVPVRTNYSIKLVLNTTGSAFQNDGDDVRIVMYNGTDWIELDRVNETVFNSTTTEIWFKLQSNISANSYNDSYYVYYGNPAAINPPANKSNVYLWFDDFNRPNKANITVEAAYNTTVGGATWNITNNQLVVRNGSSNPNKLFVMALGNSVPDVNMKITFNVTAFVTAGTSRFGLSQNMNSSGGGFAALIHNSLNAANNFRFLNDIATFGTSVTTTILGNTTYYLRYQSINPAAPTANSKIWQTNTTEPVAWTNTGNYGGGNARSAGYVGILGPDASGNVIYFDDLQIRYVLSTEPSATAGILETGPGKGDVPMNAGIPFYTIDNNPVYPSNISCLSNMSAGNNCILTWRINATGLANSTWLFYATANPLIFQSYVNQTVSSGVNITIISNLAPIVQSVFITPSEPLFSDNLSCSFNITDQNVGDTLSAVVNWYKNGVWAYGETIGVIDSVFGTSVVDSSYLNIGDTWNCKVTPYDTMAYGIDAYSQDVLILQNIPPKIKSMDCLKNNQIWVPCSSMLYNQTIGKVRANCTSRDSVPSNVTFTFKNIEDSNTFFSGVTYDNSTGYWVFDNSDLLLLDSGNFNLSVSCTDVNGTTGYNSSSWFIPWGNLTVKLISPNVSINVTTKQFFNFTSVVTCTGGECGYINATLDPYTQYFFSFENTTDGWTHNISNGTHNGNPVVGNDQWHIEYNASKFGDYSWKDGPVGIDSNYTTPPSAILTTGTYSLRTNLSRATTFSFWHFLSSEYHYDGGRLEFRADNGNWTKVPPAWFITGGYNDVYWINAAFVPQGWVDREPIWTSWAIGSLNNFTQVIVNISSINATNVTFRFYFGGDDNTAGYGWYIDGFNMTAWYYNSDKGIVSMNSSALPFYTTTQNPASSTTFGCLGNMHAGDICNTTWRVNASDAAGVYYFYVIYNAINYSGKVIDKNTSSINITIVDNLPPYVSYISLDPQFAVLTQDLVCSFSIQDISQFDTLGANITWYRNNTIFSSTNFSVLYNNTYAVTIGKGNLTVGDSWKCGVTPYDQQSTGVQVNSTAKTVVPGIPPDLNTIQCLRNDTTWINCTKLVFGDKLSGVRVNCTNINGTINNASINFSNVQDSKTYFNITTTTNTSNWWNYYYNMTIADSGDFIIGASCNNNYSVSDADGVTWSLPWGKLVGLLVNPNSNTIVEYNSFFTFTTNVTCVGGECGNISSWLDPGFLLGSPSNGTADSGEWRNPVGGNVVSGTYVSTQVNDTLYYIAGRADWGDTDSMLILNFNLSSLNVDAHKNITSIKITSKYCHSGKTLANFVATGCNGATPSGKEISIPQTVRLYNRYTSDWADTSTWDTIGTLNITDNENLVTSNFSINGTLANYVNASGFISVSFDMITSASIAHLPNPAWLGINYAMLTVTYEYIKGGAPVPTAIGAFPFYTNNSNPYTMMNYSCLGNMSSLTSGCQVTWNVNATGKPNTTYEFWVIYNSSSYPVYVADNSTNHIWITIFNSSAVPPVTTLNSPAPTYATQNSNVLFNCSATDNKALVSIELYGDFGGPGTFGSYATNYVSGASNTTTYNLTLPEGVYTWNCLSTDNDNNIDFANINRTLIVDHTPPDITLSTPLVNDNITVQPIAFNFTVIDATDTMMTCNITADGVVKDSGFAATNNTKVSRNIGGFTQGDHYWNITCWDRAGNIDVSDNRMFTILNTPPIVVLQTIDNYMTNSPNVDLFYFADDNRNVTQADLYVNGLWNQTDPGVITGATNGFSLVGLSEGIYNWTVNVTDDGGLTAQAAYRKFIVDLTPPKLNLSFPPTGYNTTSNTVIFNFTATDTFDSLMSCKITINGVDKATGINANNGSLTSKSISSLNNGLSYWNITCYDDAGNFNVSETRLLNISAPPTVALNNPVDNATQQNVNMTLYYTPQGNGNNLTNCTLYINNLYNQSNTTINSGVQNNFKLYYLPDGIYYWNVTCKDISNTTGSSGTKKFYIDNTPPNITLNRPNQWETVYGGVTTFNFTANDTLDAVAVCDLYVDGAINKTNIQSPSGQWINVSVAIPLEGNHTWSMTCRDHAGNSNSSTTRNFTIIGAPTVTIEVPAPNAYLNYTNNINFSYIPSSGNTLMNATLYINGVANQTIPSPANGFENSFFVNFTNGVYIWSIGIIDNVGLNGSSANRTLTIDTVAPIVNIMTPSNGQTIGVNNVTFKFNITENIPAATSCNITVSDVVEWSNVSVTNGTVITRNKVMYDGNYNWSVTCIDNAGNRNTSALTTFTVFAPPNVTLNFPTINYRTKLQDIVFNYTPKDDIGLDNCTLFINNAYVNSSASINKNVPNYFYVYGLSEGDYNWTVSCRDSAPDSNVYAPTPRNFTIDLTPPAITMIYPGIADSINTNTIQFNWTATDYPVNIACMLFVDGVYNQTVTQLSGTYFTPTVTNLTSGPHNWSLNCSDDLNNYLLSSVRSFTISNADLYLDTSRIFFNNTNPDENQTIKISANVSNIGGVPVNGALVNFYDGDPGAGGTFIGNATGNVNVNSSTIFFVPWNITIGYHTIFISVDPYNTVSELSKLNNNATTNISILKSVIISPSNGSQFVNPNISVSFILTDYTTGYGSGLINYSVYVDNILNGQNGTATDAVQSQINVTVAQGTHGIKIEALDALGRRKNSTSVFVTVDYTPPNSTILTPNNTWYNNSVPIINITSKDNVDTNINYTIYVNGSINTLGNITNGSSLLVNLSIPLQGYYQLIMEAFDDFNNTANSTPTYIYIDWTRPSIVLNSPFDGANYTTRTVVLNYTPTDNLAFNLSCNVTLDGVSVASQTVANGNSSTYTANNLAEGTHYWNVTCKDQALNYNTSVTQSFNVYIAPVITLLAPLNNNWSNSATNAFIFNVSDETGLQNCSIWINGTITATKTTSQLVLNNTNNFTFAGMSSGTYNWSIECYDNTTYRSYNSTSNRTLYVDLLAPQPIISTIDGSWFNVPNPSIAFNITDNMDPLLDYTFYVNGTPNVTGTVSSGSPTAVNLINLQNGTYTVVLEAFDNAGNRQNSSSITIYIDSVKPSINLTTPLNNTNVTTSTVNLNFTPTDNMASTLICNLTLDGAIIASNLTVNTGVNQNVTVSGLVGGNHYWNVTCMDQASNRNTSATYVFYVVMPDIFVNASMLYFSDNNPVENESENITATITNIGQASAQNFTVEIRVNDVAGTILYSGNISLAINGSINISTKYNMTIGDTVFFVLADTPLASNGTIMESNESNNVASRTLHVGLWEYVVGSTYDKLVMSDVVNQTIYDWLVSNASGSKLFATDIDSNINWRNLQALGINMSNQSSNTDFSTLDSKLGSVNFSDSVNKTFTVGNAPIELTNYTLFTKRVINVPIVNSTNNSNFKTGILWDYGDGGTKYTGAQDVVFVSPINKNAQGYNATVDYELRIPATLRSYKPGQDIVVFYAEIN